MGRFWGGVARGSRGAVLIAVGLAVVVVGCGVGDGGDAAPSSTARSSDERVRGAPSSSTSTTASTTTTSSTTPTTAPPPPVGDVTVPPAPGPSASGQEGGGAADVVTAPNVPPPPPPTVQPTTEWTIGPAPADDQSHCEVGPDGLAVATLRIVWSDGRVETGEARGLGLGSHDVLGSRGTTATFRVMDSIGGRTCHHTHSVTPLA